MSNQRPMNDMRLNSEFHLGSEYARHVASLKKTLWFYQTVLTSEEKMKIGTALKSLNELVNDKLFLLRDQIGIPGVDNYTVQRYLRYIEELREEQP